MKKDASLLLLGIVIGYLFFYFQDETTSTHDAELVIKQSYPKAITNISDRSIHALNQAESIAYENAEIESEKQILNGLLIELNTIHNSESQINTVEDQQRDLDWEQEVVDKVFLEFANTLSNNSAWIEHYECKSAACLIMINHPDGFDHWLKLAVDELEKSTSTKIIWVPDSEVKNDESVLFLLRQGRKSSSFCFNAELS